MSTNFSQTASYIWSLADLLRGDFKQSQYGRIILPFTILRRLECVLAERKKKVVDKAKALEKDERYNEAARDSILLLEAQQSFYNTSKMELSKLGKNDIKRNLLSYVNGFSADAREIFEHFRFDEFVTKLDEANLLFKVVQKVAGTDLSPAAISNHDMGLIFEELIRKFAESSNETAGEHFTPRDIVRLTTSLVFMEDNKALAGEGVVRTIYDPTAGTGGFLSSGMEYVHELNSSTRMRAYGQELNPESYAICKGDMLIKGQDVSLIKLGNTLSNDQLPAERFDYMLSNPPFGVDWKKVEGAIKDEHDYEGFSGRFGPGLPRVSDGSLLFLMHLLSKMQDYDTNDVMNKPGSRIGIILNGSPLFTGGAGSGESEIRRYILENDLLEAIVALPTDMFYNTGIATYVWILSNRKQPQRKGKVQLINGVHLYQKMRKSLGAKRNELGDEAVRLITETFGDFETVEPYELEPAATKNGATRTSAKKAEKKTFGSKTFPSYAFGYRRITIERPLRLSVQFTDERVEGLRFQHGKLHAPMQRLYEAFGMNWTDDTYGDFSETELDARALLKTDFPQLKEKQRKDILSSQIWHYQRTLLRKGRVLQVEIGKDQHDDFNAFTTLLKNTLRNLSFKLDAKERKQFLAAVSWTNPAAEPVIKTSLDTAANHTYGAFIYQNQVVQFHPDSTLRDQEDVPLTAETSRGVKVNEINEAYFDNEVSPHVPDAWIDPNKRDSIDDQIGIVGYEISFNQQFYQYDPPRDLAEIDTDLNKLSIEIMEMLREVQS